jgi:uncharacterized protein (UPF0261 family)
MRTTPEENAAIGRRMAEILSGATAWTRVILPLRGISALDAPGQPFYDPLADAALFRAIHEGLDGHDFVEVMDREEHINDRGFALGAAMSLRMMMVSNPRPE